jgi:hypothetical protein
MLVFFFCPKASESEYVEKLLMATETKAADKLKLTVFVNPNLVDMGVTGKLDGEATHNYKTRGL